MATPNPSYYFTLFKKFQVLGHLPENAVHGAPGGLSGFDLTDPNSVFGSIGGKALLQATHDQSPLWAMLNAAATGQFQTGTIEGQAWPAMPTDTTTAAWNDFQVNPPPSQPKKLVDAFGDWIDSVQVKDVPTGVIGNEPGAIKNIDQGVVSPFVCSFAGDDGSRPGGVPNDYWDTSLIYLLDPSNGQIVNPNPLTGGSEFYLTAVIGNRGQLTGGKYSATDGTGTPVQAKGIVMVWNTVFSPGVELPSLSN